jgi:hypothetical protein
MKPTGTKTALEPVEADRLIELEAIIDAGIHGRDGPAPGSLQEGIR